MMMTRYYSTLIALSLVTFLYAEQAQALDWKSLFNSLSTKSQETSINDLPIADGLKEALRVGIDKTVKTLGSKNGYYGNPDIRIPLPEKIQSVENIMRKFGMGNMMDSAVLSMNRAAEASAPYARDIVIEAISDMSIRDANSILKGGNTAATDYLESSTRDDLKKAYLPHIEQKIKEHQAGEQYQNLMSGLQKIPFIKKMNLPTVEDYVADKSLDGLFYGIAKEEEKIRQNPAARTTDLLKKVFNKS